MEPRCFLVLATVLSFQPSVISYPMDDVPGQPQQKLPFSERTFFPVKAASRRIPRNMYSDPSNLWPNNKIPFEFDEKFPAFEKIEVLAAMQEIEMTTYSGGRFCVMFVPRTNETDYLHLNWSYVGQSPYIGVYHGRQVVHMGYVNDMSLSPPRTRNLVNLMKIIGMWSETQRTDRDLYLYVNIGNSYGLELMNISGTSTFGQTFDYESVLLADAYLDSRDRAYPAILAKQDGKVMGLSVTPSVGDVGLIQHAYQCAIDTSNALDLFGNMPLECHFHTDFCTFVQDKHDDFDWVLETGPTQTPGTGPNADHSSGRGKFALASARGHHNKVARLVSQVIQAGRYCLRFSLHTYGKEQGRLKVQVVYASGDYIVLYNYKGGLENIWYFYHREFTTKKDFVMEIEATIGSGDESDTAVDDLYMYRGKCIEWG